MQQMRELTQNSKHVPIPNPFKTYKLGVFPVSSWLGTG